jgi:putative ABC transport system substrate-binding protein
MGLTYWLEMAEAEMWKWALSVPIAIDTLKDGLADLGHREGQSFVIDHRDVADRFDLLPAAVDELVKLPVDVFVVGGSESVQPVRSATQKIPIIFTAVSEPVEQGFIASYSKPGGNITGVTNMGTSQGNGWRFSRRCGPRSAGWPCCGTQPAHRRLLTALESAAASLGLQARPVGVRMSEDLSAAFAAIRHERVGGLTMLGSLVHFKALRQIADFAQQIKLPAVTWTNAFTQVGGLIHYGVGERHQWRRAAAYVDRIIRGAKPADLPVEQPTKFELVINLKAARALGLTIPPSLLARADQVIE